MTRDYLLSGASARLSQRFRERGPARCPPEFGAAREFSVVGVLRGMI